MKISVFSDITPCEFRRNRRFGTPLSVFQLLVTASIILNSLILYTLRMETISSSESLVYIRATPRHIHEDGILQEFLSSEKDKHLSISKVINLSLLCSLLFVRFHLFIHE
jgi:hypothetical protein